MTADVVQAKYDNLDTVAARFGQHSENTAQLESKVRQNFQALEQGGWKGRGSAAFIAEMNSNLFPAMQRLSHVLNEARSVVLEVKDIVQKAEEEAAALFGAGGQQFDGFLGGGSSFLGGGGSSFLGGVADFFIGMKDEAKDTLSGLWHLVTTDPRETAKGLWHAATHPSELWDAFKKPYQEAIDSGHPMQAVGRGTMFALSFVLGAKGADKAAAVTKLSRAARVGEEVAVLGRTSTPLRVAGELATVAEGSAREVSLARYVAEQSTHAVTGADASLSERVVLGSFKPQPAHDFLGYIKEAETKGGRYYSTGTDVWDTIKPVAEGGNGRGWTVNREFLQGQMEKGVGRFDLGGESIEDVLKYRPTSDTAREIRYLQRYAGEYGYEQVGNSWVKVGDWGASPLNRNVGGAVGPAGSIIDDTRR